MGKLSLIGLGLYDEKDLTLRGIDEAKHADEVFLDTYTGIWFGNIIKVEKIIGKRIQSLVRKDLEENSSKLLEKAKKKKIVILVQGDPLVATTHSSLILEAKKMKIRTQIIHNSSIYSAIAESGLHIQKFGETVTIPFMERTGRAVPHSVYDVIKRNLSLGLHTLCLIDIINEEKRYLKVNKAIELLLKLESEKRGGILNENSFIVVISRIGSNSQKIFFKKISEFLSMPVKLPAVIIVPGKLHFTEMSYLQNL